MTLEQADKKYNGNILAQVIYDYLCKVVYPSPKKNPDDSYWWGVPMADNWGAEYKLAITRNRSNNVTRIDLEYCLYDDNDDPCDQFKISYLQQTDKDPRLILDEETRQIFYDQYTQDWEVQTVTSQEIWDLFDITDGILYYYNQRVSEKENTCTKSSEKAE